MQTNRLDTALMFLLALVFSINLVSMPKEIYPGDPSTMREESRSLLLSGKLAVDPLVAEYYGDNGQYVVKNVRDGLYYSKYGVMNSLMFAIPLVAELVIEGEIPRVVSDHRVVYLNAFNLLLSLVIAFLLYRICAHFTARRWVRVAYVLATFYASFMWNYLRAQSSEIFQSFFFAAFFVSLLALRQRRLEKRPDRGVFMAAWFFVLALTLTKTPYVLIGGVFVVAYAVMLRSEGQAKRALWLYQALKTNLLPSLLVLLILGAVNSVKFGSPFLTGYHQWAPEKHGLNGSLWESAYGLLFSVQWSLLFNFPLLIIACFGAGGFLRRHAFEYGCAAGILLLYVAFIGHMSIWRGEWCYGPRYFLFVLPIAALPALHTLESWAKHWKCLSTKGCVWLTGLGLVYSFFLQMQVNRLEFMTFYQLQTPLNDSMSMLTTRYFIHHHYGRINWDFLQAGGMLEVFEWWRESKSSYTPRFAAAYQEHVQQQLKRGNYYWFD